MDNFDALVARFGKTDAEIKELKKENDKDKEEIKNHLASIGEDEWTAGGYKVKRVVATSDNLNEEKVLALMQKNRDIIADLGIIKTKEYVDASALESAIYEGKLPASLLVDMNACRETKTTVSLRCSKAKEA